MGKKRKLSPLQIIRESQRAGTAIQPSCERKEEIMAYLDGISVEEFAKLASGNILLSDLSGSEKQVAWAKEIRAQWLAAFDEFVADCDTRWKRKPQLIEKQLPEAIDDARKFIVGTSELSSASAWIKIKTANKCNLYAPFGELQLLGAIPTNSEWSDFYTA